MYVSGICAMQNALLALSIISNLAGTQKAATASNVYHLCDLGPTKDGRNHTHTRLSPKQLSFQRYLSGSEILQLKPGPDDKLCRLPSNVWNILKSLDLCRVKKGRTKRGKRGGKKHHRPTNTDTINPLTTRIPSCPRQCTASGHRRLHRNLDNLITIKTTSKPTAMQDSGLPSIALLNARSLVQRIAELSAILNINKTDIAAISETWFPASIDSSYFSIPGYSLFSRPRSHKRGGGVAFYIRDSFQVNNLQHVTVPDQLEILWMWARPRAYLGQFLA